MNKNVLYYELFKNARNSLSPTAQIGRGYTSSSSDIVSLSSSSEEEEEEEEEGELGIIMSRGVGWALRIGVGGIFFKEEGRD